ncbi:MAG: CRISPR-associated endonuclease Cas1 [Defluviicoccus sp.]|nr:CRISPR-associated endonuclease Cas1 [Defluviicoccus sp.]MDE0279158.1 CRISPR-associated endonuclease Cas1 [Defluviicoccus sp.]
MWRNVAATIAGAPTLGRVRVAGSQPLVWSSVPSIQSSVARRVALSLVNRRQLGAADFDTAVSGAVSLSEDARKTLLAAYQERKRTELTHPFLKEKTTLGLMPFIQAALLARRLRDDLDGYPPFVWR